MKVAHVLRKPFTGSVAENIRTHGTGALNIDAGRIHSGPSAGGTTSGGNAFGQDAGWNKTNVYTQGIDRSMPAGRWPANLVLQHLPECRQEGTKRVKGTAPPGPNSKVAAGWAKEGGWENKSKVQPPNDAEGMETVAAWACAPGCPVAELDRLSLDGGMHIAGNKRPPDYTVEKGYWKDGGWKSLDRNPDIYGDSGGASWFFKQVGGDK